MYDIILIVAIIFWSSICIIIAKKKGRGMVLAGVLGGTLGIIAIIGYMIAKNKNVAINNFDLPSCPRCNSNTVLRTVKKGKYTGKQFYVCINFPDCKGRILVK